ncbi:MAG TPA: hypothetical protein VLF21_03450 [Candidatus Saccharimonadales bacterium]|nr:hypothetical protein [Candidatus Saccharimonadales bacterium]
MKSGYPYQICVSGSARGAAVTHSAKLAEAAGKRIAERGQVLITGATSGLPDAAAKAAKQAGGVSIGFSPAVSRREHIKVYRLPVANFDSILCTGFGYTGRDLLLVRSADAVVTIGGRVGTLQEFAVAFEEKTPIGIVTGSGGVTDAIKEVLKAAKRNRHTVIFDDDPARLVDRLITILDIKYAK